MESEKPTIPENSAAVLGCLVISFMALTFLIASLALTIALIYR